MANFRVYASFCHKNISNWIECFNPSDNTWTHVTTIPTLVESYVLKEFAMVSQGDSMYIIGGRLCSRHRCRNSSDEGGEFYDVDVEVRAKVLRYNVQLNEWSECAQLGVPRYDFACAMCENKIYVAGGKSKLGSARGIRCAEVYDPMKNEWTPLPNMNTSRYKCVGVTWQGKIHVVGGFAMRENSDEQTQFVPERSSAEVYDTLSQKWDLRGRMWQLDVPPNQIVPVDERLFSSGDCFKAWKGHIEQYDGQLNIWNVVEGSRLKSLNAPFATSLHRLYLTMAPLGTHLYFFTGYRVDAAPPRAISVVHVFDTTVTKHAWRSYEPMEEDKDKELCSHCCVVQISQ